MSINDISHLDGAFDTGIEDAPELAVLLQDALESPPVPVSLLRTLDERIESQWGQSPQLVSKPARDILSSFRRKTLRNPRATSSSSTPSTKWRRVWPIVVAVAAVALIAFLLNVGSPNYAWASVLDAISRQATIQIGSGEDARRLEGLPPPGQQYSRRTGLLLRFLLGRDPGVSDRKEPNSAPENDVLRQSFRVVDERWVQRSDHVSLQVQFLDESSRKIELDLRLDPETSLPQSVKVRSDQTRVEPLRLSYPAVAIINQNSLDASKLSSIKASEPSAMAKTETELRPVKPEKNKGESDANRETAIEPDGQDVANLELPFGPVGAASRWRAVETVSRRDDEVLRRVNEELERLWKRNRLPAVAPANQTELLRRVFLDLAGRTPSVAEVRAYLKDASADRYETLVDRLLRSPDHASHLAATWRSHLIPEGVDVSAFGGQESFDRWLTERFASGDGYDAIVRELLLAEGRLSESGPLLFYSALKLDADQLAARTSRLFLGIRLECAQCHDHPFEPWTQKDFWGYAAFFAQISRPMGELKNASTVMQVRDVDHGEVTLPESETVVPPKTLGLQGDDQPEASTRGRREHLAGWLTDAENPYFARASVNRVWAMMFGRGIVDPVDDFGTMNPPVAPELLDELASQLIESDFDLNRVFRTVALSRAYRLSSESKLSSESSEQNDSADNDSADNDSADSDSAASEEDRLRHFAQMGVKTLTAAQLFDCISVATSLRDNSAGNAASVSVSRIGNTTRDEFLIQFASPVGDRTRYQAGIPQALTLMNGGLVAAATGTGSSSRSSGLLRSLDAPFFTNDQRIEVLFLATLSRRPQADETRMLREMLSGSLQPESRDEVLSDILWALLNSAEFSLNH